MPADCSNGFEEGAPPWERCQSKIVRWLETGLLVEASLQLTSRRICDRRRPTVLSSTAKALVEIDTTLERRSAVFCVKRIAGTP